MQSKDMIDLIKYVEKNQHGITKLYPSRITYFQKTHKYDTYTIGVTYDSAFDKAIADCEEALDGRINRPTAKKILNSWYCWALEQRNALNNLLSKGVRESNKKETDIN